ncbi:hypothetical protein [Mycolicibacterium palauense]|uniref:hypothetical protein n=1 Tax=Mycolicibacterium palauense TaxID=2034511 RepID=UPI000BFEECBD|nr:hypothetical protein [Mycolicibacterium palauense]
MIKKSHIAALAAGGICAVSLAVAPIASAAQATPTCSNLSSRTTLCQSNGSASLQTSPEVRAYGWSPYWYGYGGHYHR